MNNVRIITCASTKEEMSHSDGMGMTYNLLVSSSLLGGIHALRSYPLCVVTRYRLNLGLSGHILVN